MAGLFVPQMVAPIDTKGLASLGQSIGQWRDDAAIANIMQGIDPYDPNSTKRVIGDLYGHGSRQARDMADRLQGLDIQRGTLEVGRGKLGLEQDKFKYGKEYDEAARGRIKGVYESLGQSGLLTKPLPTEDDQPGPQPGATPGVPAERPPAQRSAAPAPQQVSGGGIFNRPGGEVPSTARTVGDEEGVRLGLYDLPVGPTTAPVSGRVAGSPPGGAPLQQLPPPPPRNIAATGPTPSPLPPASLGPMPSGPAVVPVEPPQPLRAAAGAAPIVPSPSPGATAPGLAGIPPVAPRYETVVGAPPPEPGREAPRRSDTQIQAEITQLNARKLVPEMPKEYYGALDGAIKQRQDELTRREKQDEEVYKARIKYHEGYKTKTTEHALDESKKIRERLPKDIETVSALSEQQRILEDGLQTGVWSSVGSWTRQAKDYVGTVLELLPGVDKGSIQWVQSARDTQAGMERFNGVASNVLSDLLGGFGGRATDTDAKRQEKIVAETEKSVTGNARLIKYAKDRIQLRIEAAREVDRYTKERMAKGELISPADISSIQAAYGKYGLDKMEAEHAAAKASGLPGVHPAAPKAPRQEPSVERTPASVKGMGRDLPQRAPTAQDEGMTVYPQGDTQKRNPHIIRNGVPVPVPLRNPGGA